MLSAFASPALQIFDFGTALGLICAIVVALLVIFILVAIWVYRDAESRGMNGTLWAVLLVVITLFTVLGGVIVLIIYLVIRSEHPVGGSPYMYGAQYPMVPPPYPPPGVPPAGAAPPPGAPMAAAGTTCKHCGAPLAPGATFCGRCGNKV